MIIKTLHPEEAQKIAAGEVVERPAHIIKELIENSLDAQATKITISVDEAGKDSITISDNGYGMEAEDARISFLRHTTSKLSTFDDLYTLSTFGFRGEALASVCGIAQVIITTRHAQAHHGIELSIQEGAIQSEKIVGCPIGTNITVKYLFFNVLSNYLILKHTNKLFLLITQIVQLLVLAF